MHKTAESFERVLNTTISSTLFKNSGLKICLSASVACSFAFDLLSASFKYNPDMVHFGIEVLSEDGSEVDRKDIRYYNLNYEGLMELTDLMILHVDASSSNKLFRRDIIEKYALRFEKMYFEDYL